MKLSGKIVLVVPRFPVISETFIVHKFTGLIEKGADVHIVCQEIEKKLWDHFQSLKQNPEFQRRVHQTPPAKNKMAAALFFPMVYLKLLLLAPVEFFRYWAKGFKEYGFGIFLKLYLDSEIILLKPDLVHFEFGALAVGRTHLKKLLNSKMAVSFRGYDLNFSGLGDSDYYSKVWREADAVHCLGNDLWLQAVKRGCPSDKPHVLISPAVDTEFFIPDTISSRKGAALGAPARPIRLLSVGRLEWKKGYEFSLKALSLLKKRGIDFTYRIVGEGEYLEALAFCRYQLNLIKEAEFLGALDQTEILKHLQWADLFIHPAVSEGFCNAVLEAQAMELPVVCSDAGGLPENVENGLTGFVVPRRDPEAMAEKVMLLSQDIKMREDMGKKGRQRAMKLFNTENQINFFGRFYSDILKN